MRALPEDTVEVEVVGESGFKFVAIMTTDRANPNTIVASIYRHWGDSIDISGLLKRALGQDPAWEYIGTTMR